MITAHSVAATASVAMHVVVAAVIGGHRSAAVASPSPAAVISFDIASVPAPKPIAQTPTKCGACIAATVTARPPTHKHSYRVRDDHDAHPHDPALAHLPLVPNAVEAAQVPVPSVERPSTAPLRFVLATSSASSSYGSSVDTASSAALAESQVSVPARLLASVAARYPNQARYADLEADVPLEIVVDAHGHVVSARVQKHGNLGFDEAAIAAVRAYRFSAALKNGHAVSVRMRWTVQFRLR
jgi:TonB family protein